MRRSASLLAVAVAVWRASGPERPGVTWWRLPEKLRASMARVTGLAPGHTYTFSVSQSAEQATVTVRTHAATAETHGGGTITWPPR